MPRTEALPLYLETAQDFRTFMAEEFEPLTNTERGERFASAALLFLRSMEWVREYPGVRLNPKKASEMGRDIISDEDAQGSTLIGEAKYALEGVEQFDSVLSKWHEVEQRIAAPDPDTLFTDSPPSTSLPKYTLVAGVQLDGIIRRYESQTRASRAFYDKLQSEGRLHVYALEDVYKWLKSSYLRQHGLPTNFALTSSHGWTSVGSVHLGAISGNDLVQLVDEHGEALFFENIRGWLGERSRVNSNIIDTIKNEPTRFLERNNGITLRVRGAVASADGRTLQVSEGNIVNGCQTTMSIWHSRPADPSLLVQVKVVDAVDMDDAWKIAEAANYQNTVTLLELKLAQYLRPQLVSKHGARLGAGLNTPVPNDLESVVQAVTSSDTTYELAKYLFLGLFSKRPNDLFSDNYERMRMGIIGHFYEVEGAESRLFETLFSLMQAGQDGISKAAERLAKKEHSAPFVRVFQDTGTKYQAIVILLAVSGSLNIDLSSREDEDRAEAQRLAGFLEKADAFITEKPDEFRLSCLWAVNTLFQDATRDADDPRKTKQYLFGRVEEGSFSRFFNSLRRNLDLLADND